MPVTKGQGQGDSTEWKQRGISAACAVGIKIFKAKFGAGRYQYFHFDLNAGCGFNEDAGCIGSPIAFLRAADEEGLHRLSAHFCDIDPEAARALVTNPEIGADPRCFVYHSDNRGLVADIPAIIDRFGREDPRFAIGSVLADPNGTQIPAEELAELARAAPRLDFIVNVNATAFKRNGRGDDITDLIHKLGKSHWLIRRPTSAHHFTLMVGRNIKTGNHPSLGFYDLESDFGQHLLTQATKTRRQMLAASAQIDAFNADEVSGL